MTNMIKIMSGSVASLLLATYVHALDVGVGASVGGVDVGVGASVGYGPAASVGAGASVGGRSGVSAGADALVGGGSTASAGAGVSVGGSGTGSGGTDAGGSTQATTTAAAATGAMSNAAASGTQARVKSIVSINDFLGATVVTADSEVVGMVEKIRAGGNGNFVATVRMNAGFGAPKSTIQLSLKAPKGDPDMIRIGLTKVSLLTRING